MRPAGRGAKKTPVYESQKAKGAVFGAYYGWERASWFAKDGQEPIEEHSFRRGNWHAAVKAECLHVQAKVGVIDLSPFTKFEISGAGAHTWIQSMSPNKIPTKVGAVALAHPLTKEGGVAWEFSITQLASGCFYMMAPAAAEQLIEDWLCTRLPKDGSVNLNNITDKYGTLVICGPDARRVLSKITPSDLSNEGFPWFTSQEIILAGVPIRALRMNFVGELGWEIHHLIEHQQTLYDALMVAGEAFDIGDFGLRAMDSMRLEKGYAMWGHDLTLEYSVLEANLAWFVKMDGADFEGKKALIAQKAAGLTRKLVLLDIDTDIDASAGMEPIYSNGKVVGECASGGYGHRTEKSLALAYIDVDTLAADDLEVRILGSYYPATVTKGCIYDRSGEQLKS
jgi:dimethylglycine dehydrogenase